MTTPDLRRDMLPAPLKPYAKTVVAALLGFATWLATATSKGGIDTAELGALPLAVLTAMGVYAVKNTPLHLAARRRPLRADRGAVEPGSVAVGFLLALAFVVLIAALRGH